MNEAKLYLEIAIWSQVFSSIVFIAALVYLWVKWMQPVFLAAQERSNQQIAEAERHRDEVKGALEALREEIETARHDAGLIQTRAQAHAERERHTALSETTEAGERALQNASRELERARASARRRLRDELLDKALQVARQDAQRRIDAAVNARLVDRFISSLAVQGPQGADTAGSGR